MLPRTQLLYLTLPLQLKFSTMASHLNGCRGTWGPTSGQDALRWDFDHSN